jgi:hypothetical protein
MTHAYQNGWIDKSLPSQWHANKAFLARQGEDAQLVSRTLKTGNEETSKRTQRGVSEGKLIVWRAVFAPSQDRQFPPAAPIAKRAIEVPSSMLHRGSASIVPKIYIQKPALACGIGHASHALARLDRR